MPDVEKVVIDVELEVKTNLQLLQNHRRENEKNDPDDDGKNNHEKFQNADEAAPEVGRRKFDAVSAI